MERHPSRTARSEHRWPAVAALVFALLIYALIPNDLLQVQRFVVVGIGIVLLIPLIVINPHRLDNETSWSRTVSVTLACVVVLSNQVTLVFLIFLLVGGSDEGPKLLQSALQVWVTNVIGFALLYWEIDRGGPVMRTMAKRTDLPVADFRFPQDEDHDAVDEVARRSSRAIDWTPAFVDYLYFSMSNSMAFSPTDTMPLSPRAKMLMGLEAFGGFVILALVIARAVSLIG
ncbi:MULTISPECIES: hypothetical protein [unclassified Leifsonia]|uniref:hypothetical protein n=1 Tax=unclassified Leifsonia TaxID=2663824 RepID=UPI0006F241EB|nr:MULTISPECIES: hypothetical protein [unclassified Leifsonia]KQX07049.1 hypothetical protein ASC59_04355 [Leifsonia sp. Root1293]KRA11332.1 hypothetical protein ASD61_04355 [Leifsonia sp. Root60]